MTQPHPEDNLWFRRYFPAPSATARLVCLPHAGGSAPFFRPMAAALSPGVDVVAVQYPGRQDRRAERPIEGLAVLADHIYGILRRQPRLPVTFFGHSMGAVIGFEVARRLEADGHDPAWVFVSGRRAPSTYRDETVHLRDDAGIMAEVRKLNGTTDSLLGDDEMMRAVLPALRADYCAIETYDCAPQTVVGCPITALTGDADPNTTVTEARAWAQHTTSSFSVQVFTGGHFFLIDHADEILKVLDQHFRRER
jgi:surfactin synthase thioesterase subunit